MIISMPCDRERRGSQPFSLASLAGIELPAQADRMELTNPSLVAWIVLCHRYSRQSEFVLDFFPTLNNDAATALPLKIEINRNMTASELAGILKAYAPPPGADKPTSNCA